MKTAPLHVVRTSMMKDTTGTTFILINLKQLTEWPVLQVIRTSHTTNKVRVKKLITMRTHYRHFSITK